MFTSRLPDVNRPQSASLACSHPDIKPPHTHRHSNHCLVLGLQHLTIKCQVTNTVYPAWTRTGNSGLWVVQGGLGAGAHALFFGGAGDLDRALCTSWLVQRLRRNYTPIAKGIQLPLQPLNLLTRSCYYSMAISVAMFGFHLLRIFFGWRVVWSYSSPNLFAITSIHGVVADHSSLHGIVILVEEHWSCTCVEGNLRL